MTDKIAVILVRGTINVSQQIHDTLKMLKLRKKNSCVVLDKTPNMLGMVKKVKDLVTWGEVSTEVVEMLKKKMKNGVAHLQPPLGGFGRKGIKAPFTIGGALGYRKENINDLIKRMSWQ